MEDCKNRKKSIFLVVNVDKFFLSHRKEIAIEAQKRGFEVTIVTNNTGKRSEIEVLGLHFIDLPNIKSIQNPLKELKILMFLISTYRTYKPDIIHHVGLKLVLFGTIAAILSDRKKIVNAISGLGILFT